MRMNVDLIAIIVFMLSGFAMAFLSIMYPKSADPLIWVCVAANYLALAYLIGVHTYVKKRINAAIERIKVVRRK